MGGQLPTSMRSSSRWPTPPGDRAISQTSLPFPFPRIKATHLHLLAIAASLVLFCRPLHSHIFYVTNTRDDGSEGTEGIFGFEILNNIIGLYKTGTRDISSASFSCMKIGYNPPQQRVRTSSYRYRGSL